MARGPAAADGALALQAQLDAYWADGHKQCDAVSFLGEVPTVCVCMCACERLAMGGLGVDVCVAGLLAPVLRGCLCLVVQAAITHTAMISRRTPHCSCSCRQPMLPAGARPS